MMGVLGLWVAAISFIGVIISLFNPKHSKSVGIVLIILGVIGNIFLIIPGIMALWHCGISRSRFKQNEILNEVQNN